MSRRALFGDIANRILSHRWKNADVQLLAEELAAAFNSTAPITLKEQLTIDSQMVNGPPIDIRDSGGSAQAMRLHNADGVEAVFGLGLQNKGLIANDLVPHPVYRLDPEVLQQWLSNFGNNFQTVEESVTNNVLERFIRNDVDIVIGYGDGSGGIGSGIPVIVPGGGDTIFSVPPVSEFFTSLINNVVNTNNSYVSINYYGRTFYVFQSEPTNLYTGGCGIDITGDTVTVARGDLAGNGLAAGGGTCDIDVSATSLGGDAAVFKQVSTQTEFRGVTGGTGIAVTENASDIDIDFDYTNISGYVSGNQQVLGHDTNGNLTWYDVSTC